MPKGHFSQTYQMLQAFESDFVQWLREQHHIVALLKGHYGSVFSEALSAAWRRHGDLCRTIEDAQVVHDRAQQFARVSLALDDRAGDVATPITRKPSVVMLRDNVLRTAVASNVSSASLPSPMGERTRTPVQLSSEEAPFAGISGESPQIRHSLQAGVRNLLETLKREEQTLSTTAQEAKKLNQKFVSNYQKAFEAAIEGAVNSTELSDGEIIFAYYYDSEGGGNQRSPLAAACKVLLTQEQVESDELVCAFIELHGIFALMLNYLKPGGIFERLTVRDIQDDGLTTPQKTVLGGVNDILRLVSQHDILRNFLPWSYCQALYITCQSEFSDFSASYVLENVTTVNWAAAEKLEAEAKALMQAILTLFNAPHWHKPVVAALLESCQNKQFCGYLLTNNDLVDRSENKVFIQALQAAISSLAIDDSLKVKLREKLNNHEFLLAMRGQFNEDDQSLSNHFLTMMVRSFLARKKDTLALRLYAALVSEVFAENPMNIIAVLHGLEPTHHHIALKSVLEQFDNRGCRRDELLLNEGFFKVIDDSLKARWVPELAFFIALSNILIRILSPCCNLMKVIHPDRAADAVSFDVPCASSMSPGEEERRLQESAALTDTVVNEYWALLDCLNYIENIFGMMKQSSPMAADNDALVVSVPEDASEVISDDESSQDDEARLLRDRLFSEIAIATASLSERIIDFLGANASLSRERTFSPPAAPPTEGAFTSPLMGIRRVQTEPPQRKQPLRRVRLFDPDATPDPDSRPTTPPNTI